MFGLPVVLEAPVVAAYRVVPIVGSWAALEDQQFALGIEGIVALENRDKATLSYLLGILEHSQLHHLDNMLKKQ